MDRDYMPLSSIFIIKWCYRTMQDSVSTLKIGYWTELQKKKGKYILIITYILRLTYSNRKVGLDNVAGIQRENSIKLYICYIITAIIILQWFCCFLYYLFRHKSWLNWIFLLFAYLELTYLEFMIYFFCLFIYFYVLVYSSFIVYRYISNFLKGVHVFSWPSFAVILIFNIMINFL